jgi:periplasmic protein TonB
MSHTLSRPSPFQRSGLLSVVVGLHVGVFLLIMAAKTVVPQIMEIPLVVDLLETQETKNEPVAKPLPMAKPVPVKAQQTPAPKASAPVVEATQSTAPPPAAVLAAPAETKPAPAAPPAEPVSQARFDVDYLKNPAPPYPPLSRRMGEEGKVVLRVSVSPQGLAENVEIRTSSGSQRLDESALKTVRNWKFIPAKRGDSAVQSWVLVPIIFKLEQ